MFFAAEGCDRDDIALPNTGPGRHIVPHTDACGDCKTASPVQNCRARTACYPIHQRPDPSDNPRKLTIPTARQQHLTSCHDPAVSSLEA
jgi:hypothetical protein